MVCLHLYVCCVYLVLMQAKKDTETGVTYSSEMPYECLELNSGRFLTVELSSLFNLYFLMINNLTSFHLLINHFHLCAFVKMSQYLPQLNNPPCTLLEAAHSLALAVLKLTVQTRRSICLCLLNPGIIIVRPVSCLAFWFISC